MTRKELQAALKERGISQASIAKEAGITPQSVSLFLRRKFRSKRLSDLLDQKLGMTGALR